MSWYHSGLLHRHRYNALSSTGKHYYSGLNNLDRYHRDQEHAQLPKHSLFLAVRSLQVPYSTGFQTQWDHVTCMCLSAQVSSEFGQLLGGPIDTDTDGARPGRHWQSGIRAEPL